MTDPAYGQILEEIRSKIDPVIRLIFNSFMPVRKRYLSLENGKKHEPNYWKRKRTFVLMGACQMIVKGNDNKNLVKGMISQEDQ